MERLLDDPDVPVELKRLVISFSDSMTDQKMVIAMAKWASSRQFDRPHGVHDTEEVRSIEDLLAPLCSRRPDLVEDFGVSVVAAVVGASLRWHESATLIEQAFPRLVAAPQRNMAVVAIASILKPTLSFTMGPMATVTA